ncbi:MAG: HEPN domain-containing protein [Candidatus Rokubacteria bacterium]|nr:HEPN domain-containing protein [Candidatus Rokubacteria bacterium]
MSRLRLPSGDDHPEAARKHLEDASVLLPAGRADGAAYLAGYVVECALKSLILVAAGHPWGHDLNALGREALQLAALPEARSARYIPRMSQGHPLYDAASGWRETLRYREPGAVTPADAGSWLGEAQAVYESAIVPMRLDGVV